MNRRLACHPAILFFLIMSLLTAGRQVRAEDGDLRAEITAISALGSRYTGSSGFEKTVQHLTESFKNIGLKPATYRYFVPVRQVTEAKISLAGRSYQLQPFLYNAISPGATKGALTGPVIYVGQGTMAELDGKQIAGALVVMEFDSGRSWQLLASLGARALIYIDRGTTPSNFFYREKQELSPLQFPCFWLDEGTATAIFGQELNSPTGVLAAKAEVQAKIRWHNQLAENIYALIPGTDPKLQGELLILEAFFDSDELVAGLRSGADQAISIASLLHIARKLKDSPPGRSVLLVASSGHAQTLAGLRDMIWSISSRTKELRDRQRDLQKSLAASRQSLQVLTDLNLPLSPDRQRDVALAQAINRQLKLSVDDLSRRLMKLRVDQPGPTHRASINELAEQRFSLRRLGWAEHLSDLPPAEYAHLTRLIPLAKAEHQATIIELEQQLDALKSANAFRSTVREYEIAAVVSLHLSSHGDGIGGFHQGWLYNLKPTINRAGIYSTLDEVLSQAADGSPVPYQPSLRPDRMRNWDSWFLDKPALGGEVSSLAGLLGISLVTTGDSRAAWGTPWDTIDRINWPYLTDQTKLLTRLVDGMTRAAKLQGNSLPEDGLADASAQVNLLLQGELFADHPAAGTTILAYQGLSKFYAMVDRSGQFQLRGLADKKHVLDKLIIEGYRFDEDTGETIWAIDKKETGRDNYRLKMLRKSMKTDLVMFNCRETTVFDLLEPRNFHYLTKLDLFDGRRDAQPQHYWYSRIDTRKSTLSSIYLEPGSFLKMTFSDTVLTRKMLLSNGTAAKPLGTGFAVDNTPAIFNTSGQAARDAWTLLEPRIENLETHGIFDEKISSLATSGLAALKKSGDGLARLDYSTAREAAAESLALAARVYVQIEKTQKDVLFGVLFYIALFVPFAFCMERFLFHFAGIYQRIVAFSAILLLLITIIYQVHPAFQLAYSPLVVILAFFIIGLSFLVTLIIFFRFEEEMLLLQRRASHQKTVEISRWQAFAAAFFLGVSNLRRRRLRTILTCSTLIILTFTIMSFTTIKSNQEQTRLLFQNKAAYNGLLLKKMNWQSLPREALAILANSMDGINQPAPRVWLEADVPTHAVQVPLRHGDRQAIVQGLIGLSPAERTVTGLDGILSSGRWLREGDRQVILLEDRMAATLGLTAGDDQQVKLWGVPFTVIGTYAAKSLEENVDLDGEPLTPVTFPDEAGSEISEIEQEAIESGDDVRSFQSRYRHIAASQTAIIPATTLLAMGGNLKNIAVRPEQYTDLRGIAQRLVDRFSMVIFAGEKDGVWLYNVSDTMKYSGVPNIIIPLLISVLIVLNTMISSVYERKNEIAVYTSVGLAPSHVSFLFIAEALALGVISVVLGYIIAQVSAALFSTTPLWAGITVNYSSMAGVAAMLLVILVVLISVIYPSMVAARIAIPDVNRTFNLPAAVNNQITVRLPFLMKYEEHESIGGFIHSYFLSHQDISHGIFSTGPTEVVASCASLAELVEKGTSSDSLCMHLRAKVWLAPFDFGIMQNVDIHFCPAEEGANYLAIRIVLTRQSGESAIWHRLNTSFLHELRKQLLVWRSIDAETHNQLARDFHHLIAGSAAPPEAR